MLRIKSSRCQLVAIICNVLPLAEERKKKELNGTWRPPSGAPRSLLRGPPLYPTSNLETTLLRGADFCQKSLRRGEKHPRYRPTRFCPKKADVSI